MAETKAAPTIQALESENSALKAEIEALRAKLPKNITARAGHKVVFISSKGVAAIKKNEGKYIQGSVNGVPFEVLCDEQVEVSDEVAEALRGVIEAQKT